MSQPVERVLEVRECPHGRGVFAARDLSAAIWTFEGVTFTTDPKSPPSKRWALVVGKTPEGKHLFWDEEPEGSPNYWSNFLDHDDAPNVRFLLDVDNGRASLVALRPVKRGEELFLDYGEYDPDNWVPQVSSVAIWRASRRVR